MHEEAEWRCGNCVHPRITFANGNAEWECCNASPRPLLFANFGNQPLVERPPASQSWVHEIKLDGYRLKLRVEQRKAALRTRNGLEWTAKFPEIARAAQSLPDCIVDGEVV